MVKAPLVMSYSYVLPVTLLSVKVAASVTLEEGVVAECGSKAAHPEPSALTLQTRIGSDARSLLSTSQRPPCPPGRGLRCSVPGHGA